MCIRDSAWTLPFFHGYLPRISANCRHFIFPFNAGPVHSLVAPPVNYFFSTWRRLVSRLRGKAPGYTVETDARMYPFIHFGHFSIGTFGLCLWLASVCACWTLYRNFRRHGIDADAVGVAAYTTAVSYTHLDVYKRQVRGKD